MKKIGEGSGKMKNDKLEAVVKDIRNTGIILSWYGFGVIGIFSSIYFIMKFINWYSELSLDFRLFG